LDSAIGDQQGVGAVEAGAGFTRDSVDKECRIGVYRWLDGRQMTAVNGRYKRRLTARNRTAMIETPAKWSARDLVGFEEVDCSSHVSGLDG
jgi:hypothetical protein